MQIIAFSSGSDSDSDGGEIIPKEKKRPCTQNPKFLLKINNDERCRN